MAAAPSWCSRPLPQRPLSWKQTLTTPATGQTPAIKTSLALSHMGPPSPEEVSWGMSDPEEEDEGGLVRYRSSVEKPEMLHCTGQEASCYFYLPFTSIIPKPTYIQHTHTHTDFLTVFIQSSCFDPCFIFHTAFVYMISEDHFDQSYLRINS